MSEKRTPPPPAPDAPDVAPDDAEGAPLEPVVGEPPEDGEREPDNGPGGDPA